MEGEIGVKGWSERVKKGVRERLERGWSERVKGEGGGRWGGGRGEGEA